MTVTTNTPGTGMVERLAALCLLFILAGCGEKPWTNDRIISEIAKCKAAGLEAIEIHAGAFGDFRTITSIQCQQPYTPRGNR